MWCASIPRTRAQAGRRTPAVALLGQPLVFDTLLKSVTPDENFTSDCAAVAGELDSHLSCEGVFVTAHLVGLAAAGLHLPGDAIPIVVVPNGGHAVTASEVAAALRDGPYSSVTHKGISASSKNTMVCSFSRGARELQLHIRLASADPAEPLAFLAPGLTAEQREALAARTSIATAAFLDQQPELFKTAVRLANHWAIRVHDEDWGANGR
jgi:hypothetical protein